MPRISQEIFVFPSEYFIYSMFCALFWGASWSKITNILYASTSRMSHFSKNKTTWVLWTPTDSRGVEDIQNLSRLKDLMINEKNPPTTACQQDGFWPSWLPQHRWERKVRYNSCQPSLCESSAMDQPQTSQQNQKLYWEREKIGDCHTERPIQKNKTKQNLHLGLSTSAYKRKATQDNQSQH